MSANPAVLQQPRDHRAVAAPWQLRVLDLLSAYLPLLLMALLALGTWWLVKNTPLLDGAQMVAPPRHEPDYTMTNFVVQRFDPDGSLRGELAGARMEHYPDTNTLEIEDAHVRAFSPDGRLTVATARRAVSNADGSEIQLIGDAHVVREATDADAAIEFNSEFLHFFQASERVRSHLPVTVRRGGSEFRADAMEYDNLARVVELKGHMRAIFVPPPPAPPASAVR